MQNLVSNRSDAFSRGVILAEVLSPSDQAVTIHIPTQDAVRTDDDALVMLVQHQQVHLAIANPAPPLHANRALCGQHLIAVDAIGVVDEQDFAYLQDFTICPDCASRYATELRQGILAKRKAAQMASQPHHGPERLSVERSQLSLF